MPSLNEQKVKSAKPRERVYRLSDGLGLCLEIKPSGKKFWRYRYMLEGRATMMTIGEYPLVGLAEARRQCQDLRAIVKSGVDAVEVKRQEKAQTKAKANNTFAAIYQEWLTERMAGKSQTYLRQINDAMAKDILPAIGDKPIDKIKSSDVLTIINNTITRVRKETQRKNVTGEITAINNRQFMSAVFQYAVQTLRAETDPTYVVRRVVKRPDVEHARHLSSDELKKLVHELKTYQGSTSVKGCMHLMALTMTRTKEARHARWEDIDLTGGLWTIPAELMKKRRLHLVPLSKQAVDLLTEHKKYSGANVWCFPSPKYPMHPLGATTINRALQYMELDDTTGHDFRATASTILNANGFNADWIELQLAHVDRNVTRRSYNHADHLQERRQMLQWWADYLDGLKVA